jgi:SAM-dependent methyltransferase
MPNYSPVTEADECPPQSSMGGSPERFGYAWNTYATIFPEYEEQFRRWLPFFSPDDWRGKRFLDVGCGMGRNSFWPMKYGASSGIAVDIDERSLAAARRNLCSYVTLEVCKCSAYELPWRDEFDIAFSIGVIHHLEFPEKAVGQMSQSVKPGGHVAIWVYGRENNGWLLWILNPARKLIFRRLPVSWVHFISFFPAAILWMLLRIGLDQIEYFRFLRTVSFRHLRSIVFDQMLPKIANYWSKSEVEFLMRHAALEDVEITWVNEMSWAARGRRAEIVHQGRSVTSNHNHWKPQSASV